MIAIVDYGMGNLRSVQKAFERVGAAARIVSAPREVVGASKLVLPGVGAFGDAIARLRQGGLDAAIVDSVQGGTPFLGICLGLQLLFDVSYEDGEHTGLGILPGKVVRFCFDGAAARLPVPHVGWNALAWNRPCPLLRGVPEGAYVYFVHGYHVQPLERDGILTTTEYGHAFVSSVWRDNVYATQFHPEKSQSVGLKMLENFAAL